MLIGKDQLVMNLHEQNAAKAKRIAELEGQIRLNVDYSKQVSKLEKRLAAFESMAMANKRIGELEGERDSARKHILQIDADWDETIAERDKLEGWHTAWQAGGQPTVDKMLDERNEMKQKIRELEGALKLWKKLSKAQDRILVAYRVGGNPGKAIDQASDARAALAKLGAGGGE